MVNHAVQQASKQASHVAVRGGGRDKPGRDDDTPCDAPHASIWRCRARWQLVAPRTPGDRINKSRGCPPNASISSTHMRMACAGKHCAANVGFWTRCEDPPWSMRTSGPATDNSTLSVPSLCAAQKMCGGKVRMARAPSAMRPMRPDSQTTALLAKSLRRAPSAQGPADTTQQAGRATVSKKGVMTPETTKDTDSNPEEGNTP